MGHRRKTRQELREDARVDEALAETFPASDVPSYTRGVETALDRPEDEGASALPYLIGGFALGAFFGLLLALRKARGRTPTPASTPDRS